MATFPTKESEIVVLAETMVAGYTAHPADFPSITSSAVADLTSVLGTYQSDKQAQTDARAQATIAPETKIQK
jgi:hypothetical protein